MFIGELQEETFQKQHWNNQPYKLASKCRDQLSTDALKPRAVLKEPKGVVVVGMGWGKGGET